MKNMDNYRWIIPSLIALGVILLSGGIFVGVKSYETLEANKYTLENEDGYISVFKYNKEGKKELVEKTSIQIKSLPKSVQEELKDAIVLDNEDDAYSRLEDFGS